MLKRRSMSAFLAILILGLTASLTPLHAGDKEWARVGKGVGIVTGVSVLHQLMWVRPHVRVRYKYAHRVSDFRHSRCTHHRQSPRTVVVHKPAKPVKEKSTSYIESTDKTSLTGEKTKKGSLSGDTSGRKIEDATAVIFDLGNGRRLYQQKIKGKKAQLQVWSEVEKRWVGIKEYPSLY